MQVLEHEFVVRDIVLSPGHRQSASVEGSVYRLDWGSTLVGVRPGIDGLVLVP